MPGIRLNNVELMENGCPRGLPYSGRDFWHIQQNFNAFSRGETPLHRVPFVIGHEEDTGRPAEGLAESIGHDGKMLRANIENVRPAMADFIRDKRFFAISPEIYEESSLPELPRPAVLAELRRRGHDVAALLQDSRQRADADKQNEEESTGKPCPPERYQWMVDGYLRRHLGKMLRRISALGGEPAQQKGKADIPQPEYYAETRPVRLVYQRREMTPSGAWAVFSEVRRASKHSEGKDMIPQPADEARDAAAKPDAEMLETDEQHKPAEGYAEGAMDRQAMLECLGQHGMDTSVFTPEVPDAVLAEICRSIQGASAGQEEFAEFDADPGTMTPEDMDRASGRATMARDKSTKFMAACGKMAEPGMGGPVTAETAAPRPMERQPMAATYSEQAVKNLVKNEIKTLMAQAEAQAESAIARRKQQTLEDKRAGLQKFCEGEWRAGFLKPIDYDVKTGTGPALDLLMSQEDTQKVHKFSEGGKLVVGTQLDAAKAMLRRGASLFAERVQQPNVPPEDGEIEKIKTTYQRFSEQFPKITTLDGLVEGFKIARKYDKTLTARDFLKIGD